MAKPLIPGQQSQGLLNAYEAERLVQGLAGFAVQQIGTEAWVKQHTAIEKLNLQAHFNAQQQADEFVVESLLSHDKLNVLVQGLLTTEVWKEKVLPQIFDHLSSHVDSISTYILLYHEAGLANLLELALYHPDACKAIEEDLLLELCDWCYRKLLALHSPASKPDREVKAPQDVLSSSPEADLQKKHKEVSFGVALCALSILRYITDGAEDLPMSVGVRLVNTSDTLLVLAPLLDNPPWLERQRGTLYRWQSNSWRPVDSDQRLVIDKITAQVWLTLSNLVLSPAFRDRHVWTGFKKDLLGRVRGHMNELLYDQLPVLQPLQQFADQVVLTGGSAAAPPGLLVLEQVPSFRDALLRQTDWAALAEQQRTHVFPAGRPAAGRSLGHVQDMAAALDFLCDLEDAAAANAADTGVRGSSADVVRVHSWRLVGENAFQSWHAFDAVIDRSRAVEQVTVTMEDGALVRGERHRLKEIDAKGERGLPPKGKICVTYEGKSIEVLLDLPGAETRGTIATLSPVVWATVGVLATDGFAFQVKLRRGSKDEVRDRLGGVWCCYFPVGGAFTLRTETTRAVTCLE